MAASCLTVAEFLSATGTEFSTFGAASTGTIEISAVGSPGDTITIGGVDLTAVAGARSSGSNDFSLASGTELGVAQSIVDALSDTANGFVSLVTAAVQIPGVPIIQLTSVSTGYYSTLPLATSDAVSYVLSGDALTGGPDLLDTILTASCSMLGSCWGSKKSDGHLYLTAHFLSVASGNEGGSVSSRSIDKISESYAVTPPSDPDLGSTKWGRMYLALKKTIPNLGITVGRGSFGLIGTGGCC